ncbi:MAG: GNAT family N-acetyltransferase [Clostridia bacterium]|nr:GNAT family N-acetyltransferase [Clostridia bacterium]
MRLHKKHFSELTVEEFHDIVRARIDVFVVEQDCPYSDLDGKDKDAWHVWLTDGERLIAYCRVLKQGTSCEEASIGRVICLERRKGYGTRVLNEAIALARRVYGADAIRIHAQKYAKPFYEGVGFKQCSEDFLEDGIVHVEMIRTLTDADVSREEL